MRRIIITATTLCFALASASAQVGGQGTPWRGAGVQPCFGIDGGANKAGVAPADALAFGREVAALPRLRLRGIMTIPEPAADYAGALAVHLAAKELWDRMRAAGLDMDTLSMGMSADLEAALAAGSTMVRVGSALFGSR